MRFCTMIFGIRISGEMEAVSLWVLLDSLFRNKTFKTSEFDLMLCEENEKLKVTNIKIPINKFEIR